MSGAGKARLTYRRTTLVHVRARPVATDEIDADVEHVGAVAKLRRRAIGDQAVPVVFLEKPFETGGCRWCWLRSATIR